MYYPHHYQAGKKYPLVLMIHGGPHGADMDGFADRMAYPYNLFAQKGVFILCPNYHGSSNYGLAWGESISGGHYNDYEWIDCDRGVDAMIARGFVDPDKLGVMGWSNGSIITIEITTHTTRYKVASAGAGDVDWTSDWGNCQFGDAFDEYYLGTTPLANPDFYMKKSPLFKMGKVTTPTIIFFGTIDRQVPTEQGWLHYQALRHIGKTPVKFILFPGEAHGPRKFWHQRRKMVEEQAWFNKYLFGTPGNKNESLKRGSPLAAMLKLQRAGTPPETVRRGGIAIGRFEVTRAQFATFQKFPPWLFKPPSGQDFLVLLDGLALPGVIGAEVQGPIIRLPSQYIGRFAAATIFVNAPTTALLIYFVLRVNGAPVPGWTLQTFARAATNLSIDFEGRVDMPQSCVMDVVIRNRAAVAFTVGAQITGWSWPATTLEA